MKSRVLLTGCCGFIGAWMTQELIRAGYSVRGTSIDPAYAQRLHDEAFASRKATVEERERLEIVRAELLDGGSWRGAADGCDVVVHTACPVNTDSGAGKSSMHDPAVLGTENVVREAARAGSIQKFIHLSSVVTLLDHYRPVKHPERGERLGPGSWNETASSDMDPYAHAKVIAERSARRLVQDLMPGTVFASLLPGPVIGPAVAGERVAASIEKTMAPFLSGQLKAGSVEMWLQMVDVRDVAAACVGLVGASNETVQKLGENSRFIVVSQPVRRIQEIADIIAQDFPEYRSLLPKRSLPLPRWLLVAAMRPAVTREAWLYTRAMLGRPVHYDTSLTEALSGVHWRTSRETLGDTIRWLREKGRYLPNK